MHIVIRKNNRQLFLLEHDTVLLCAAVGLGRVPAGAKSMQGDGKTPEGIYHICLIKPNGKYGRSLGLSYPNLADASDGLQSKRITTSAYRAIARAVDDSKRPPWGTPLGGEIYIHEGGSQSDWTQGCIALNPEDMDILYPFHSRISRVEIYP